MLLSLLVPKPTRSICTGITRPAHAFNTKKPRLAEKLHKPPRARLSSFTGAWEPEGVGAGQGCRGTEAPASPFPPMGPQPTPPSGTPDTPFLARVTSPSELSLGERDTRLKLRDRKRLDEWRFVYLAHSAPRRPGGGWNRPGCGLPARIPLGHPGASPPLRKCFVNEISMQMLFYYYYATPSPLACRHLKMLSKELCRALTRAGLPLPRLWPPNWPSL